jgi:signal transduction histidine kinase
MFTAGPSGGRGDHVLVGSEPGQLKIDLQLDRKAAENQSVDPRPQRLRRRLVRGRWLLGVAPVTIGLAIAAAALAAACTWQANDASRSSEETARELALSRAYQDIDDAAGREYDSLLRCLSAGRGSGTTSAPNIQRDRFIKARAEMHEAVDRVNALGTVDDRALATTVLVEDRQFSQNARTVFVAVQAGQMTWARELTTRITGPKVDTLISLVSDAAAKHQRRSEESITRLTARSRLAAIAIPTSFGLALLLLGACWVILLQLNKAVRSQASELLADKQLLSTVIESSPYFVYWKDAEGHYLGGNHAFEQLRGSTGASDADDVRPDSESAPLIRQLSEIEQQVQAASVAVMDQQAMVPSPDGEERRLLFSVLPRQGPDGPEGVIGVGVDVTRLTALERQLATASRLESVGRLAAGLAHEINTPVQVLSSNTEFVADATNEILAGLKEMHDLCSDEQANATSVRDVIEGLDVDFLQGEIPKALSDTQEVLERVAGIVRAMSDFAGGGQGFGACRLNQAVQAVVEISRHEWSPVADLTLTLDPALDTVICHEGEIKESLLAILINAAEAMAEKRERDPAAPAGTIEVRTEALPDGARITVRDGGTGMDDAVRQRIFDPFFTTKVVGKGMGQGLNFAYRAIVTRHGGSIDVTSLPGDGTTFTIELPSAPPS